MTLASEQNADALSNNENTNTTSAQQQQQQQQQHQQNQQHQSNVINNNNNNNHIINNTSSALINAGNASNNASTHASTAIQNPDTSTTSSSAASMTPITTAVPTTATATITTATTTIATKPPVPEKETKVEPIKILCNQKCSRIILSFLRLSQIVVLSLISTRLQTVVRRYYGDCKFLDLSEYYGGLGSPEFDLQAFCSLFLPRFRNVESLSMRYCSHLKSLHLDSILLGLAHNHNNSHNHKNGENSSQQRNTDNDHNGSGESSSHESSIDDKNNHTAAKSKQSQNDSNAKNKNKNKNINHSVINSKLVSLNLYFCNRLGSRSLWKIGERLPNLQTLNLARCYSLTAKKNINALKALISLKKLERLAISLDPSIDKSKAIEIVSVFMDEDSFPKLNCLDLAHGCEVLIEIEDLRDLEETRNIRLIRPKQKEEQ